MIDIAILADRSLESSLESGAALLDQTPSATGLLRCLGQLAAEARECGLPRTAAALYDAISVGLRESFDTLATRETPG